MGNRLRRVCRSLGPGRAHGLDKRHQHLNRAYRRRCGNRFIREYFAFDWLLRTEKVAYLERRESGEDFEEKEALRKAFVTPDILRREQAVCNVVWDKIENLVMLDVFNINVILAFLAKFHIIARWNRLDRVTGRKLFDDFVQEIDETYDKNKIEF